MQNPPQERPVPRSAILPGSPYMEEEYLPASFGTMQDGRMVPNVFAAPQPMERPVQMDYGMPPAAQTTANPGYTPGVRTAPMEYLMAPPIVQQAPYPTFDELPRDRAVPGSMMQQPSAPIPPMRQTEPEVRPAQTAVNSMLENLGIPRQVMRSIEVQKLYASFENKETIPQEEPAVVQPETPPAYEAPRSAEKLPVYEAPAYDAQRAAQPPIPRQEQTSFEAPAAGEVPRRRRRAGVQPMPQEPEAPAQPAPVSQDGQTHRRRRRA